LPAGLRRALRDADARRPPAWRRLRVTLADAPWDVIVIGAGAAGMTAACVAAGEGCRTLLVEQATRVGGTTAISGGMVWIPANHKASTVGRPDDLDAARTYLAHVVPHADPALVAAYLDHGDEAIRHLEAHTKVKLQPVVTYPDYYPDLPGATLGGRVLEPVPFDGASLGRDFALLRDPLPELLLFGGMMVSRQDIPHLRRAGRSLRSAWHVGKLLARHARQRLRASRGTTLYLGNALAARLLASVRACGVTLATGTAVTALRLREGRVADVVTTATRGAASDATTATNDDAADRTLQARRGVILATGGLSHGDALRARYVPPAAGTLTATVSPAGAARGASLARDVGATLSPPSHEGALWVPVSTFMRADGSPGTYPHTVADRAKPGLIAVNHEGRRFVNEARSYHEFVRAQLRAGPVAIPAWLLCDRDFLWRYGLGRVKPFTLSVERHVRDGYLRRASSIEALATAIAVSPEALAATVAEYNPHARDGHDPAFGRGGDAYQRHLGDADRKPNPCVAPIERAPFYAVAVHPADLGMAAGIRTDANARALDAAGRPIPGLYACGNDMHSVLEGAYPGPGITLGPALTFGYLAARHAARRA